MHSLSKNETIYTGTPTLEKNESISSLESFVAKCTDTFPFSRAHSTGLRHAQKWQYSFRGDYVHVVCFFNSHCFTFSLFLVKTKPTIRVLPHLKNESIFVCIFHLSWNCLPPNHQNWAKMAYNLPQIWCYSSWNTFIFVRILIYYLISSRKNTTRFEFNQAFSQTMPETK